MSTIALYHAYNPEMSSALVSVRQAVETLEAGLLSVKLFSEMVNAFISFGIGSLFAGLSEFLKLKGANSSNKFFQFFDDLKVGGVNSGNNNWAFRHNYWLGRYENTSWLKLDFKTIIKGFWADVITDAKRYTIEIPKGIIDEGGDHVSDAVFE